MYTYSWSLKQQKNIKKTAMFGFVCRKKTFCVLEQICLQSEKNVIDRIIINYYTIIWKYIIRVYTYIHVQYNS